MWRIIDACYQNSKI